VVVTDAPSIGDTIRHPNHRGRGKVLERVTLYGNPELVSVLVKFRTGQHWHHAADCRVVKRARRNR
jgi:hypothetical protein